MENKLISVFWDFLINLMDTFQEIWARVVKQESYISTREITNKIASSLRGPFFWAVLKKDERLMDFSKGQFERGGIEVLVPKGQHRLERKMVKWGINNPETPWFVLENTTIGAREAWWESRAVLNEISLKLDADI